MTLYTIRDLPTTNDSYIHPSPNQVGINKYWLIYPNKWGYTRYQLFIHDWNITSSLQITIYDQKGFIKCLQQIETNYYIMRLGLKIHSVDSWMTTQSCIVGDMMMMSSYLCDDRLRLTYVDWFRSSQMMILGSCRSWCWWDGYGVSRIW